MPDGGGGIRILLVPEGEGRTRSYGLSVRRMRLLKWAAGLAAVLCVAFIASWTFLLVRALEVPRLEEALTGAEVDQERMRQLAARIQELERRYEQIRALFGSGEARVASDLWLPPRSGRAGGVRDDPEDHRPTSWPLTQRGFVTQGLLEGGSGAHPGLDIAVPAGSYVRAAGAGVALEVGEDEIYGLYVLVDHGDGYETLYAHASQTLVRQGDRVRRNEVIALSGSTGRSTAPHLHFEVLLNGDAVDPLTLVDQPS